MLVDTIADLCRRELTPSQSPQASQTAPAALSTQAAEAEAEGGEGDEGELSQQGEVAVNFDSAMLSPKNGFVRVTKKASQATTGQGL